MKRSTKRKIARVVIECVLIFFTTMILSIGAFLLCCEAEVGLIALLGIKALGVIVTSIGIWMAKGLYRIGFLPIMRKLTTFPEA